MKKQLLIITTLISSYISTAQSSTESINLAEGKTNQSYFSLENGEVDNVNNQDWDLAFDVSGRGSSIRINGQNSVELQVWPDGKISDWASVDTANIADWGKLHNSTSTWTDGAFDQNKNGTDLDLGWGTYNTTTHATEGDSIYIIKLADKSLRKIYIDKLYGGAYTFKYANIDGTDEVEATISKEDYTGKNFGYYSVANKSSIDREPASEDWDLVFGKYLANGGSPSSPYYMGFTGVLSNLGVTIAEARHSDINSVTEDDNPFEETIDVIGSDWKTYNREKNEYTVVDTLAYFINDQTDAIWKISFTNFVTSNGAIDFKKELISDAGTGFEDNSSIHSLAIYPNPTSASVHVLFTAIERNAQVTISNLSGQLMKTETLTSFDNLVDVQSLQKGIYYLTLEVNGSSKTEKLVIK